MGNKIKKNILFSFIGQIIIIVMGLIVPRIMIVSYGSDTNGLLSTITQIFTYMALLEAGVGQATKNALYKPILENDRYGISKVVSIGRNYFRKLTVYYAFGVIVLAFILSLVLKSQVGYFTIFLIVLLEGMSGVCTFWFVQTNSIVLDADGKGYVNNIANTINRSMSYSAKIVLASIGANIVFLQICYFLISVTKAAFYNVYFKKKYPWIEYNSAPENAKPKDRNAFLIAEITWTIFSSTDMIILSTFVSTRMSSVYAVYNMVFTNLHLLLNSVYQSLVYLLGQSSSKNIEDYKITHDFFNSVFMGLITVLMSTAYILIIPFIKLYTNGVTDINYIYTSLPILFCMVQLLSWSRYISGNLVGVAGRMKEAVWVNVVEAVINIFLSIVLVNKFGIVGVLLATVVALPLKTIYCNYVADRIIMKRRIGNTIKVMVSNFLFFFVVVFANHFIALQVSSYREFFVQGLIVGLLIGLIVLAYTLLLNKNCLKMLKTIIRRKRS